MDRDLMMTRVTTHVAEGVVSQSL
jgi:hypothetical protein